MESQDKLKRIEQLQKILDKLETNEEKLYSKERSPKILDLNITSFLDHSIAERKNIIYKKIEPFKLNSIFYRIISILIESLNKKKTNLLLLDDIINIFIDYDRLVGKEVNIQSNFDRFMTIQKDFNEPKYNFEDIKELLFSESNIQYHKYLNGLNENFYTKIHNEFLANLEIINNKYKKKINKLELILKGIRLKYKQNWPNLSFQGKVNDFLIKILYLNKNIGKFISNFKINQAIGACFSISKHIKRFINVNLHPKYSFEQIYNGYICAPSNNFIDVDDVIEKLDKNSWENLPMQEKIKATEDIEALIEGKVEPKDILYNIKQKYNILDSNSTVDSSAKNPKDEIIEFKDHMLDEIYIPDTILEENINAEEVDPEFDINYDDMPTRKNSA